MKHQLVVDYVLVSGQIMVQLDPEQFQWIVAEEELTVIHGFVKEHFLSPIKSGYYYIASNGTLTYYLKISKPIDEITPDIIAKKLRVRLFHVHRGYTQT